MSKIKVVIWSIDPRNIAWEKLSLEEKLNKIAELIEEKFNTADYLYHYEQNNHQLSGIFLLPEYAFSTFSNMDSHQLDQASKEKITTFFKKLSSIPGLLIIPGTVPYVSPLDETKLKKLNEQWASFKEEGVQNYGEIKASLLEETTPLFNKLIKEKPSHYSRNAAYCFFRDESRTEKYKINKRESLTDDFYQSVAFIPGLSDPTFDCMGFKVGVSICRDMLVGYLSHYKEKVDIEIVLSDFISMKTIANQLSYPHVIIHAATNPEHSGTLNTDKTRLDPDNVEIYEGHELHTYTVSLPTLQDKPTYKTTGL
jgi:predicted amidohydrolase